MRIGIYGGTFSPVHNGHVIMAKNFIEQLKLDKLLVIPTFTPPHKSEDKGVSPWDRYEMLRLAFQGYDKTEVSDIEIKRRNVSYTIDTLRALENEGELYLLCGSDMFLTLETWREASEILRLAKIVLGRRESSDIIKEKIDKQRAFLEKTYGAEIYEIAFDAFEISSSEIRKLISENRSVSGLLPESVERYIAENRLYAGIDSENKLDEIRKHVSEVISPHRLSHTLGVEAEIARLGGIFMPDKIYKLRVAALLHDITKEYSTKKQLLLCQAYGIKVDRDLESSPKLFHAQTGAYQARALFGDVVDDEIFDAILCHTTGKRDMTLFDKLLYLADYIEEGRSFEDCVYLRNYFYGKISSLATEEDRYVHLQKTLYLSFNMTVEGLRREGAYVSLVTMDAMGSIKKELEEKLGRKIVIEDNNVKEL